MMLFGWVGLLLPPTAGDDPRLWIPLSASIVSLLSDDILTSMTMRCNGRDDGPLPSMVKILRRPSAFPKSILKSTILVLEELS